MGLFKGMPAGSLERREMQLILFASSAIIVLAGGLALFMYPVVFSQSTLAPARAMSAAFFGFCALSILLALYLLDRQATIARLRQQIGDERKRASEAIKQASVDLLGALPNLSSFQDQLSMEYRRDAAAKQNLSVLVVSVKVEETLSEPSLKMTFLGDAAKAIARKLRGQDSIYLLASGVFGVILPGLDMTGAQRVTIRLTEGLADAAGVNNRFSFKVDSITYPEQVASARDLELAVTDLVPVDVLNADMTRQALVSQ